MNASSILEREGPYLKTAGPQTTAGEAPHRAAPRRGARRDLANRNPAGPA